MQIVNIARAKVAVIFKFQFFFSFIEMNIIIVYRIAIIILVIFETCGIIMIIFALNLAIYNLALPFFPSCITMLDFEASFINVRDIIFRVSEPRFSPKSREIFFSKCFL